MGNCYKKQATPVHRIRHNESTQPDDDDDDDAPYMLVLSNAAAQAIATNHGSGPYHWWHRIFQDHRSRQRRSETPPALSFCRLSDNELDKHITETLTILRNAAENDTMLMLRMRMFKFWANGESGWNMVLSSLVRVVPLDDVLGPSAITLFIDHCPLPTRQAVMKFVNQLDLSRSKAVQHFTQSQNTNKSARHRNICAVLGHVAELLAGPLSCTMLTDGMLDYFLAGLDTYVPTTSILYSLIAIEKFSQTGENKHRISGTNIRDRLLELEKWASSLDYKKRQVGFSARWLLDNAFLVDGRALSYEEVELEGINAMLNCNDVSEYLKISANGLEARSDASSFESVRCTFSVDRGVWYYEVTIVTPGVMQIGWATKQSKFFTYDGFGIGDDEYSCAYDGCRRLYWHRAHSRQHSHPPWKEGDILGLLLDVDQTQVIFYLNGQALPPERGMFNCARSGFFAAASFMSHQQCMFNFGAAPFKFPPADRSFQCFNDHAQLSDEEKLVLPKHKKMQLIEQMPVNENTCDLCCDLPSDTTLLPCGHGGMCHRCADVLDSCPLCRGEISEKIKEPHSAVG